MANSQGEGNAFATPRSSTWIVLNCILLVIALDSCCSWLDKGLSPYRQVSSLGCFAFKFRVLRFRVLGASFSRFGSLRKYHLSSFTCLMVDFGKVLCSSANKLQQNSNASSREDYIPPKIDRFVRDSLCLYLTFVAFCLLSVIRKQ